MPVIGLGSQPAEQFTGEVELVGVNLLPGGQGPCPVPVVFRAFQYRYERSADLPGSTVPAQQRLRVILDDVFAAVVLPYIGKYGNDTVSFRFGSQTEVPPELRDLLVGKVPGQVQGV